MLEIDAIKVLMVFIGFLFFTFVNISVLYHSDSFIQRNRNLKKIVQKETKQTN